MEKAAEPFPKGIPTWLLPGYHPQTQVKLLPASARPPGTEEPNNGTALTLEGTLNYMGTRVKLVDMLASIYSQQILKEAQSLSAS